MNNIALRDQMVYDLMANNVITSLPENPNIEGQVEALYRAKLELAKEMIERFEIDVTKPLHVKAYHYGDEMNLTVYLDALLYADKEYKQRQHLSQVLNLEPQGTETNFYRQALFLSSDQLDVAREVFSNIKNPYEVTLVSQAEIVDILTQAIHDTKHRSVNYLTLSDVNREKLREFFATPTNGALFKDSVFTPLLIDIVQEEMRVPLMDWNNVCVEAFWAAVLRLEEDWKVARSGEVVDGYDADYVNLLANSISNHSFQSMGAVAGYSTKSALKALSQHLSKSESTSDLMYKMFGSHAVDVVAGYIQSAEQADQLNGEGMRSLWFDGVVKAQGNFYCDCYNVMTGMPSVTRLTSEEATSIFPPLGGLYENERTGYWLLRFMAASVIKIFPVLAGESALIKERLNPAALFGDCLAEDMSLVSIVPEEFWLKPIPNMAYAHGVNFAIDMITAKYEHQQTQFTSRPRHQIMNKLFKLYPSPLLMAKEMKAQYPEVFEHPETQSSLSKWLFVRLDDNMPKLTRDEIAFITELVDYRISMGQPLEVEYLLNDMVGMKEPPKAMHRWVKTLISSGYDLLDAREDSSSFADYVMSKVEENNLDDKHVLSKCAVDLFKNNKKSESKKEALKGQRATMQDISL